VNILIIVGLTGGIATGKSTVSAIFKKAGAIIIDADLIARQVVVPGLPAWRSIKTVFGDRVIGPDGVINRALLGEVVYNDRQARKQLEGIIHPQVCIRIEHEVNRLRRSNPHAVVIQDIPLLLETGMTGGLSEIIVVYTTIEIQLKRLMKRDSLEMDAARKRILAQMPMAEKRCRATLVIDNSGDLSATELQTLEIYENLAERAQKRNG
jgi:dephospho-CoA kinase